MIAELAVAAALGVLGRHRDAEPVAEVVDPDSVGLACRTDHVRARGDVSVAALPRVRVGGRAAGPAAIVGGQGLTDLRRAGDRRCRCVLRRRRRRCRLDRCRLIRLSRSRAIGVGRRDSHPHRVTRVDTDERVGLLGAVGDVNARVAAAVAAQPLVGVRRWACCSTCRHQPSASDQPWPSPKWSAALC